MPIATGGSGSPGDTSPARPPALRRAVACHSGVVRIGYFGSYARGDWGVGSDLDLVIVVESSNQPFERRSVDWDTTDLPVPVDALVYTQDEWEILGQQGGFHCLDPNRETDHGGFHHAIRSAGHSDRRRTGAPLPIPLGVGQA
ncbi:MAG: nucleotidyltransferase domain-containing protein, partial [Deltaproteobacteria bacterium]|nr:nucleotidyltransferase domain-containing protein [Deltaproteobacteria bacterium]